MRFGSYRAFGPNTRHLRFALTPRHGSRHHGKTYTHNLICRPHSVPTSLVISGSNLEPSLLSYVTARFGINGLYSDEIEKIAEKSAAKALGDTTKAVDAEGNRLSNLKQEFKKLLESKMFLYGITSLLSIMQNNIIEDAITAAQSDKAKAEKAEAVLNMIEEILEMLLMMLAGAGSKHFDNTSSSFQLMMQKMTALVSVVSGLGQSSLMIGQGVVQKDLATVNSKLIKQSAKLEMLDALLDQINQKQGDEISSSMQEATSFYKQMMDMSNRLSEGEKAQAQVLLSFV